MAFDAFRHRAGSIADFDFRGLNARRHCVPAKFVVLLLHNAWPKQVGGAGTGRKPVTEAFEMLHARLKIEQKFAIVGQIGQYCCPNW